MRDWGVAVRDASRAFREMDLNGGGVVLFNEFAQWALKQGNQIFPRLIDFERFKFPVESQKKFILQILSLFPFEFISYFWMFFF